MIGPTYMYMYIHVEMCTKMTPEMRTPPVIRTLQAVPRVSAIEGFHCNNLYRYSWLQSNNVFVLVYTSSKTATDCCDECLINSFDESKHLLLEL